MEQLDNLEHEINELRKILKEKEEEMERLHRELFDGEPNYRNFTTGVPVEPNGTETLVKCGQLPKWAIERYSRQILLRDIGVKGQTRICEAKVLIVGAGGLGCPAAMYLAAAGVGEIGIIDYDVVELTNIHRQILHFEHDENTSKADSAAATLRSINSRIKITPYKLQLDSTNALDIASKYDIILDCTDNVPTRYLLSDLSCLTKRPLISGSALKMEGQLTIYGYRSDTHSTEKGTTYRGPCYRCVFPTPPSPDTVGSCSAHGVAGPVPGVIGTLQAMEALKYILDMSPEKLLVERMFIFDAEDMVSRTVRLRKRNPMCASCSDSPTITHLVDYEAYCKAPANDKGKGLFSYREGTSIDHHHHHACSRRIGDFRLKFTTTPGFLTTFSFTNDLELHILAPQHRITAPSVSHLRQESQVYMVDVRAGSEFHMCHIEGARNWPVDGLRGEELERLVASVEKSESDVIFICRRGNDSQLVAKKVLDLLPERHRHKVKDMAGGLHAWARDVDNNFPVY